MIKLILLFVLLSIVSCSPSRKEKNFNTVMLEISKAYPEMKFEITEVNKMSAFCDQPKKTLHLNSKTWEKEKLSVNEVEELYLEAQHCYMYF